MAFILFVSVFLLGLSVSALIMETMGDILTTERTMKGL